MSRQRITLRNTGAGPIHAGPWVQVNRMGNPLFNELFVPLRDKDRYNRSSPAPAAQNSFFEYAFRPEIGTLINTVYGLDLVDEGRSDFANVYIPDVLRVYAASEPVRLAGQSGFTRLGLIGGDTTDIGFSSGRPNGRRFGDDVVDIALTALAIGELPLLGDNVAANDQIYHQVFPYSATPHAGTTNRKDP